MIIWREPNKDKLSPLIKSIIEFIARKERIIAIVQYSKNVRGPYSTADKKMKMPVAFIPIGGSLNEQWAGSPDLSTLSRMRTRILKKSDLPYEMKVFLNLLCDILHELGHIKHDRKRNGETTIDSKRYWTDLEYRLWCEDRAETLVTKWSKHFGFYHFVNDATKLN